MKKNVILLDRNKVELKGVTPSREGPVATEVKGLQRTTQPPPTNKATRVDAMKRLHTEKLCAAHGARVRTTIYF